MTKRFVKIKSMAFPREIIAGHNAIDRLGDLCERFELKGKVLIVTGKKTNKICGRRVAKVLGKYLYETATVILGDATRTSVDQCEKAIKDTDASFVLAVGGGSKIDIAKLSAAELRVPFISIPTSASHDGIASPRASIKDAGATFSIEATMPVAIIADTAVIVKSPYRLLASGCADVIANTTAIKDWELSVKLKNELYSRTAAMMARLSAETIIENAWTIKPRSEESVWLVIKQIISSGLSMGMAGSSRPTSGSEHLFSHALDITAPGRALHGEQCGVGAIMMMRLHRGDWRRLKDALEKIGAPTTAAQLNFSKEEIICAMTKAHRIRPDRYTILGESGMSRETAEKTARETGVI